MKEMKGNLLEAEESVIMHQVNCKGVMGAGVAYQIRKKLLPENEYQNYKKVCNEFTAKDLLGKCMCHKTRKTGKYVVDLFAEDVPTGKQLDTDYVALEKALSTAVKISVSGGYSVALPGYLGCGLAGGEWEIVYKIIKKVEQENNISVSVYYLDSSIKKLWEEFGDIPMNPDTECIEIDWHGFPVGTHREEIWLWFEETFSLSVAEDLMFY